MSLSRPPLLFTDVRVCSLPALQRRNLVIAVREMLTKTGFAQNPCLECSNKNADTPFIVC